MTITSNFYAYLSRLKWIKRWGLMRNAESENVMEHSWEVATIAHAFRMFIRNSPSWICYEVHYNNIRNSQPDLYQKMISWD
ncbi:MAG: HD domain-containing protein [Methylophaga sp.]|nr:HD domain-containing protein [Methylophaga sp.]